MIDINQEYKGMTWDDVVGSSASKALQAWEGEIPQVVLFAGPFGCGKNLLAYLFAQELGRVNLQTVDITVRNTIDNTAKGAEAMIEQFSTPPFVPTLQQVCVLNEFTLFRKDAQAKFKDIFQAPPRNTYFFVCTNEPEKIVLDIMDRFKLQVHVNLLTEQDAYELVERTCVKHQVGLHKKKKVAIARGSGGRPRTIINTILAVKNQGDGNDEFIKAQLKSYAVDDNHTAYMELFYYLIGKRTLTNTSPMAIKKLYEDTGLEPDTFRFKTLGMIYNSFLNVSMNVYHELIPSLEKGAEKHDLLVRLMRLLRQP
jgi:DNA polymerase III delta prime subunit